MAFGDSLQSASFEPRYDADGRVWIQAVAGAALTAHTPYLVTVDENGYLAKAFTGTAAETGYIGVPDKAVSSGDVAWLQIGGRKTNLVTPSLSVAVGHALELHDGAVADEGSDFNWEANEFAVCVTASTSATSQDVILVPKIHTTTT